MAIEVWGLTILEKYISVAAYRIRDDRSAQTNAAKAKRHRFFSSVNSFENSESIFPLAKRTTMMTGMTIGIIDKVISCAQKEEPKRWRGKSA